MTAGPKQDRPVLRDNDNLQPTRSYADWINEKKSKRISFNYYPPVNFNHTKVIMLLDLSSLIAISTIFISVRGELQIRVNMTIFKERKK